jgi:hypothetical protein
MKRIGAMVMLVGIILIVVAFAVPGLTIVVVGNDYTVSIPSTGSMPSSTSPSTPTTFALNGYQDLGAMWGATITQISDVDTSGTGSVTVTITDSSGYSVTETMTNSWKLEYLENYLTKTPFEFFSAQASYNFTNPFPTQSNVYTFTFTGSATYDGATFNYETITTYGEFPLQSVQHLGHFYFQLASNAPVRIANSATTLHYNVSGTQTTFQVWYVEDNGTTTPFTYAYITYQYGTTSVQVTLSSQTTLDGYTAYTTSPITIPVPTTLYLSGYVVANGAQGSPYQLMEFASNMSGLATLPPINLTINQEITIAIGSIIVLLGGLMVVKR